MPLHVFHMRKLSKKSIELKKLTKLLIMLKHFFGSSFFFLSLPIKSFACLRYLTNVTLVSRLLRLRPITRYFSVPRSGTMMTQLPAGGVFKGLTANSCLYTQLLLQNYRLGGPKAGNVG